MSRSGLHRRPKHAADRRGRRAWRVMVFVAVAAAATALPAVTSSPALADTALPPAVGGTVLLIVIGIAVAVVIAVVAAVVLRRARRRRRNTEGG